MLQEQGDLHVVGEATDGADAMLKAAELHPDLVLLEVDLAEMNGLKAAKRIRETASDAKMIFLTQVSDTDVIAAALNDGASGYVLKIDAGTELLAIIRAILRGEHFVSRASERLKRP